MQASALALVGASAIQEYVIDGKEAVSGGELGENRKPSDGCAVERGRTEDTASREPATCDDSDVKCPGCHRALCLHPWLCHSCSLC